MAQPSGLTYVGLPYVRRGRDRRGVDCWGLVYLWYPEQLGIEVPSFGMHSADDYRDAARAIEAERGSGNWIEVEVPLDGDLVLMTSPIDDAGTVRHRPVHIGIAIGKSVLHCEEGIDTVCVSRRDPSVAHRIVGYFRHRSRMNGN